MTNASGVAQASSSFIGNINPIRYRGYYYDTDLGLYYLQSRYYDPETGRFVNADGLVQTGMGLMDKNMFAYCLDDPVNYTDSDGMCARAWAAGYSGPCPGQGMPGCMDNYAQFRNNNSLITSTTPKKDIPDHPDFKPPKRGNKKVRNPNGEGKGWLAKDGGVWVWTPNMHGGDGWTIQYPGGKHGHAYPGGGVRKHYESENSATESAIMIFVGVSVTAIVLADDVTGVGVADDPLVVGSVSCLIGGLNGIYGKKICTECGEEYYGF